jgi:hypothetical protein
MGIIHTRVENLFPRRGKGVLLQELTAFCADSGALVFQLVMRNPVEISHWNGSCWYKGP